jgi:hypothetical protein
MIIMTKLLLALFVACCLLFASAQAEDKALVGTAVTEPVVVSTTATKAIEPVIVGTTQIV